MSSSAEGRMGRGAAAGPVGIPREERDAAAPASDPLVAPDATAGAEPQDGDTKARLLDAAERLFAERGFEGASLRAITSAAGTSVSAAHYHFGGKEALLRAVLQRRVAPLNRERLARLEAAERAAGPAGPSVEAILEAFLRPLFEEQARGGLAGARFVAARLYSDPPELVAALKRDLFGELGARYVEALARALPGSRVEDVALALQFAIGAMVHVMSGNLLDAPSFHADAELAALDPAAVYGRLHTFLSAGVRAAASGAPPPSEARAPEPRS